MAKTTPVYFWEATTAVEVKDVAFSLNMKDEREGALAVRRLWCDWVKDGKVFWNPSQRCKGWLKAVTRDIKPSMSEQVQGAIKVSPCDGSEPTIIGKVTDFIGADHAPETDHVYRLQEGLPQPFFRHIQNQKGISIPLYWLILPGPVEIKLKIHGFARSISPAAIKELMEKLGKVTGWGDMTSRGFGTFELKSFDSQQVRLAI